MKEPERSVAIANALAAEADGLPADFATQVVALAEAQRAPRWSWNDLALGAAFIAMIGVCVAGWFQFGAREAGGVEWVRPIVGAAASNPWLIIGIASVGIVQVLIFRRRTRGLTNASAGFA
jgi:hypothetical protein